MTTQQIAALAREEILDHADAFGCDIEDTTDMLDEMTNTQINLWCMKLTDCACESELIDYLEDTHV